MWKALPEDEKAGGVSRTSTQLTSNLLPLFRIRRVSVMSIRPEGKSCSDLGRVLVLNDPSSNPKP
jgi:hypothetical protein